MWLRSFSSRAGPVDKTEKIKKNKSGTLENRPSAETGDLSPCGAQ